MKIVRFGKEHMKAAKNLARENYREACRKISMLLAMGEIPDLDDFADNGLGVAAFEGECMVGFLCCYKPWENAFDSAATGTFSPLFAHGAIQEKRADIYKRMYEEAAAIWVSHQIAYHGITLYAHDDTAREAFFNYGFGMRCIDAIREMKHIELEENKESELAGLLEFKELTREEMSQVRALRRLLSKHFSQSPCFMYETSEECEQSILEKERRDHRVFVAKRGEEIISFVEVRDEGENFVTANPKIKNICGAFCLPEYRGRAVVQSLINFMIQKLQKEGYTHLGVDFESFNATANAFWRKYFMVYTHSLVRRIDECAFKIN